MWLIWTALGWETGRIVKFYCWFSRKYWDIHNYPVHKGGDGIPTHFYEYKCWNCNKEFGI